MRLLLTTAAAAALLAGAAGAQTPQAQTPAAQPTISSFLIRDAGSNVDHEAIYSDGNHFWVGHLDFAWNGATGAPSAVQVDPVTGDVLVMDQQLQAALSTASAQAHADAIAAASAHTSSASQAHADSVAVAGGVASAAAQAHGDAGAIIAAVAPPPLTAPGATSAGGLFRLAGCSVVSGSLAWTVGQAQALTCDPLGRLRVGLSSAALLGTTASTTADLEGGVDPNGLQQALQLDSNKYLEVNLSGGAGSSPSARSYTSEVNSALILAASQTVAGAQGAAGTGIAAPTGGSGLLGYMSGLYKALTGTLTVSGAVSQAGGPWSTTDTNGAASLTAAQTVASAQGAAGTGISPPTGGSGELGYLSGLYKALSGTLTVSGAVSQAGGPWSTTDTNGAASLTATQTIASAQGAAGTGISQPTGGSGLLGYMSGVYKALSGTLSVSGAVSQAGGPWSTTDTNSAASLAAAQTVATAQGAAGTGISQPAGGSGVLGYMSGIYKALTGTLTVSGTITTGAGSVTTLQSAGSSVSATNPLPTSGSLPFGAETVSAISSASGTATGASHYVGGAVGASYPWAYFNATVYSDQAGTVEIDYSNDNTNFYPEASGQALAAATPLILQVPVMAPYYHVKVNNGATAETVLRIVDSFSGS